MENVLYHLLGGTNFPVTKDFSTPREEAEMKISEQNIVLLIRGKSLKVLKSFFLKVKISRLPTVIFLHEPKNLQCQILLAVTC